MLLLIDVQYFPPINLYKNLYKFSYIAFDQYEVYQKMSFRNRCQVAGADGVVNLSIPLLAGRGQKKMVRDVRISNRQPWAVQHWKTIVSCYSRSPWFDHYRDELGQLYERRFEFLIDWDLTCFEWSLKALNATEAVGLTKESAGRYTAAEATDWRGKFRPKTREKGFELELGRPDDGRIGPNDGLERPGNGQEQPIRYRQVFEERTGFIPNLSILDLLFCEGNNASSYLAGKSDAGRK